MKCEIGQNVKHAAELLNSGKLVAFATETVYGLGANALDEVAVARIFHAKQRPSFDPLIVHLAHIDQVQNLTVEIPQLARSLAEKFWPGPLTILLKKQNSVPDLVTAGLDEVGIRIPSHPLAQKLLSTAAIPVAAPSANLFGQVSPTTALHVADQLGEKIDYILDGGPCSVGLESTVIRVIDHEVELLRFGGVTVEMLEDFLSKKVKIAIQHLDQVASASPGQLQKHYSPRTPMMMVDPENLVETISKESSKKQRVGVITLVNQFGNEHPGIIIKELSSQGDLIEAAGKLFSTMRELDGSVDLIVATPMPHSGLGRAINDRLQRASIQGSRDQICNNDYSKILSCQGSN